MSLDKKEEYVPNEPKKSVPSKFPRLTGRSLIIIQKYLSNRYNKSEHDSRKYVIDMELAAFLISLVYFDLPGRDSFVAEFDTDLYQSISKFVEENKETSGEKIVFDYYNSKGINYIQIHDWIQKAVIEGFMTYDKGPFEGSISLIQLKYDSDDADDSDDSNDIESFTDTLGNTRSRRPATESVFDFLWCCDPFLFRFRDQSPSTE